MPKSNDKHYTNIVWNYGNHTYIFIFINPRSRTTIQDDSPLGQTKMIFGHEYLIISLYLACSGSCNKLESCCSWYHRRCACPIPHFSTWWLCRPWTWLPTAAQQGIHIQSHFACQKCLPRRMYDKIIVFLCHQYNVIVRRMSESNKVFP